MIPLLLNFTIENYRFHLIRPKGIGHKFVRWNGFGNKHIGLLTHGNTTQLITQSHGISGVDGSSIDGLFGKHFVEDAGHGKDQLGKPASIIALTGA